MLITRETDYALRVLRTLAEGGCYSAKRLAEREELPQKFAYKIIKKLDKGGFISIARGSKGGCTLDCDLRERNLLDLVTVMERRARLTACMEQGYQCEWRQKKCAQCIPHLQLEKVQEAINEELRSRSLHWILYGKDSE